MQSHSNCRVGMRLHFIPKPLLCKRRTYCQIYYQTQKNFLVSHYCPSVESRLTSVVGSKWPLTVHWYSLRMEGYLLCFWGFVLIFPLSRLATKHRNLKTTKSNSECWHLPTKVNGSYVCFSLLKCEIIPLTYCVKWSLEQRCSKGQDQNNFM